MLNLDREILVLRDRGLLAPEVAQVLVERERRDVFSVHPEIRLLAWLGAMLVATGAGIVIKNNIERIGPLVIAGVIGAAAAACYGYAIWRRRASPATRDLRPATPTATPIVTDSILLLGALLLSADIAYIESQFHLLGSAWPRHFLAIAVVHAIGAYYFDSRALLTLSLSALAAWLGVDRNADVLFSNDPGGYSVRAFICAATILVWRLADGRLRASRTFDSVFEHFIANLALWGGLLLTFTDATRPLGVLLTIAFAGAVIFHGFRRRTESFVMYGYVYAVIALDIGVVSAIDEEVLGLLYLVVSTITAIVFLFVLRAKFRSAR